MTALERLAAGTDFAGPTKPHMDTPCHLWRAAVKNGAYGRAMHNGRSWPVHRLMWHLHHPDEPLPPCVRHRCDHRPCVNPDHLLGGTHADNMRDTAERHRRKRWPTTLTDDQWNDIKTSADHERVVADRHRVRIDVVRTIRAGGDVADEWNEGRRPIPAWAMDPNGVPPGPPAHEVRRQASIARAKRLFFEKYGYIPR